jgi:hypothetical protein
VTLDRAHRHLGTRLALEQMFHQASGATVVVVVAERTSRSSS